MRCIILGLEDESLEVQLSKANDPKIDFVLKTIESRDVHFIRCWFTDVLGNLKSFAVVPGELEGAFDRGMGFDSSSIKGFTDANEPDALAFPDPSTFQVLPWRPQTDAVGRMFCNIKTPDEQPFEGDPRHILERVLRDCQEAGFQPSIGCELEYFYFKDSEATEVLDKGSYFDLTTLDYASDLRRDTVLTLEHMGIPVEYSHHELGNSQHEIDLRATDALAMADSVMTYKLVVKEIASKHGVFASFMPKPMTDQQGSGMHIHLSLFDEEGENAFHDANDPTGWGLSQVAKGFMAGVLEHAREMSLITNQYVNSYKRLCADVLAPTHIAWARSNREAILRVPTYRPSSADACRIELRMPDVAANPYLAFAAVLAAGLDGMKRGLELADPCDTKAGERVCCEGSDMMPDNLGEAIKAFKDSSLMKEALGPYTHAFLVKCKTQEWASYQAHVSQWERDRLLAVL